MGAMMCSRKASRAATVPPACGVRWKAAGPVGFGDQFLALSFRWVVGGLADEHVQKFVDKPVRKVILVPGKLINIVI